MRIAVLDGYALNPGDLSWDDLKEVGPCTIRDRTPFDGVVDAAAEAEIVLTNKCELTPDTLVRLPRLRYVGVLATGYNVVDIVAARKLGIVVTNVPAYGTRSVAQHVFALLLELSNGVGRMAAGVRRGDWAASTDWCYWERPLLELDGLTLGIVGYGRIGRAVAGLAQAFGMRVIVHSRSLPTGVEHVGLDDLFRQADLVTLHCPLTAETRNLVNATRLGLMKPGAFLINTSRGSLVVAEDLAAALNAGRIAGAALDVLPVEPPKADDVLVQARNCLVTPHVAWATQAARQRLLDVAVGNVRAFIAGRPCNVVN